MEKRKIYQKTWQMLAPHRQMVFISGPRQCGKTTFSKIIAEQFSNSLYFNWDIPDDKHRFLTNNLFYEDIDRKDLTKPLIILDEIHKYSDWKNYLKGIYDRDSENYKFLITGSGRLNLYQKGSDSLAGRYFLFQLWPFTLAELGERNRATGDFLANPLTIDIEQGNNLLKIWNRLSAFSGFPDPFLKGEKNYYNLWSQTYQKQLIKEEVRDSTGVKKINDLEMLFILLLSRAGGIISMNNLAKDIKVSFDSVKTWLDIFDAHYLSFRIAPYSNNIARAIKKEKKIYFFDYAQLKSESAKYENMVALELTRLTSFLTESGHGRFSLHYLRTKDGVEVDFLISRENDPFLLIECKQADTEPSASLKAMQTILNVPALQLVNKPGVYRLKKNAGQQLAVVSAHQWLATLP